MRLCVKTRHCNTSKFRGEIALNSMLSELEQQRIISKCKWESFVIFLDKCFRKKNQYKESHISVIGNLIVDVISNGDYVVAVDICL